MVHGVVPTLALLVAAIAAVGAIQQPRHAEAAGKHTCAAVDRQFIHAAAISNTDVALLGQSLAGGAVTPAEAIAETRTAALAVDVTAPRDPALRRARTLMYGMYVEYGRAIRAQWKGGDPGRHMFRSYALANYAHGALADAEPALARAGCSVGPLLQQ